MKTTVFFKAFRDGIDIGATAFEFSLFGREMQIQWYGILIALGFLLAVLFGGRMAYKWKMNLDKMIDVLIGGTIGGVLGARLYYVLFHLEQYKGSWADIFKIWEGGLAIYGGLIGGLIGGVIFFRGHQNNFFKTQENRGAKR
ncbi:MAG: prolipoprotein diacylglyceryl transferase, partial [Oscillospiraceae bacterium]|nr:prolipoprotein diacylglyceryl transferase [Oscillospiraceae bacterium]